MVLGSSLLLTAFLLSGGLPIALDDERPCPPVSGDGNCGCKNNTCPKDHRDLDNNGKEIIYERSSNTCQIVIGKDSNQRLYCPYVKVNQSNAKPIFKSAGIC